MIMPRGLLLNLWNIFSLKMLISVMLIKKRRRRCNCLISLIKVLRHEERLFITVLQVNSVTTKVYIQETKKINRWWGHNIPRSCCCEQWALWSMFNSNDHILTERQI